MMPGYTEASRAAQGRQAGFHRTGLDLRSAATGFALNVMVMSGGMAAHKAHDLVSARQRLRPTLVHKTLEIAIDGGNTGAPAQLLPDILHRKGTVGGFQHLQNGPPLGRGL